jgi:hypothetical protein
VPACGGTIGIAAQETARYSEFATSLANLRRPVGWEVQMVLGTDIADSRCRLVEQLDGDHLLFLDDDQVFDPDLLERLLAHQLDVVGALVPGKHAPFLPYLGAGGPTAPTEAPGLLEVEATGTGALLVRRRVFEALEPPYFWPPGEDVVFCRRVRELGFQIFVDTSVWVGHLAPITVWPHWDGLRWNARLQSYGHFSIHVPYEYEGGA